MHTENPKRAVVQSSTSVFTPTVFCYADKSFWGCWLNFIIFLKLQKLITALCLEEQSVPLVCTNTAMATKATFNPTNLSFRWHMIKKLNFQFLRQVWVKELKKKIILWRYQTCCLWHTDRIRRIPLCLYFRGRMQLHFNVLKIFLSKIHIEIQTVSFILWL